MARQLFVGGFMRSSKNMIIFIFSSHVMNTIIIWEVIGFMNSVQISVYGWWRSTDYLLTLLQVARRDYQCKGERRCPHRRRDRRVSSHLSKYIRLGKTWSTLTYSRQQSYLLKLLCWGGSLKYVLKLLLGWQIIFPFHIPKRVL
jgi:hypothetical protein